MEQMFLVLEAVGTTESDIVMRRGVVAQREMKIEVAQQHYDECLKLNPSHAACMNNIALLWLARKDLNEALLWVERASIADPREPGIFFNWALICFAANRIDDALLHARECVQRGPSGVSHRTLAAMLISAGFPEEAIQAHDSAMAADPENLPAAISACFAQSLIDETPRYIYTRRLALYEKFYKALPKCELHEHKHDRLRVGYVSGDFKTHSASAIFRAVALKHSAAIEPYFYSTARDLQDDDEITQRFKRGAGKRWRDISKDSDARACETIIADEIDILVDLSAHSAGGRLGIFARKPAPVQVTAWGFALGTGLPEIDYFFADPVIVPDEDRKHFAEKIYDLPCVMTIDKGYMDELGDNPTIPYHKNGHVTFGCFGRYSKISSAYLEVVRQIMLQNINSKIIFRDFAFKRPYSIRRVLEALYSSSLFPEIEHGRIQFVSGGGWREHIQSYQQADIILDPFPHTGGVTSMEQIFMGVPIITRYGKNTAGRSTASLLTSIGRSEWIAKDEAEYIQKAVALAKDIPAIEHARKSLRKEFLKSPVMSGYCEAVENAYREMWQKNLILDTKREEVLYA